MRASGASAARSQPKLTTRQALASSSRVTRRGRSGRTSTPSSSKRATTFGWIAGSGSVPANVLRTARPRSSARRWNSVAAIRLFAAPWRQTTTTARSLMRDLLFHEDQCRAEDGSGADHAHGDGDKKLAFSEPARLLHEALREERNDHEATAERERPRLEEERQELAEHGANGHIATAHHEERYADKERGRRGSGRAYAEERPVIQDTNNPAGDEDQCDFGPHSNGNDEGGGRERPLQPVRHPEFREPVA